MTNGAGAGDVGAMQTTFATVPGLFYQMTFDVVTNTLRVKVGTTPGGVDLLPLQRLSPVGATALSFTGLGTGGLAPF